ncbi:glucosyltransferase domain-containing protein [Leclercia sp.]|uniref:glucosyltransferase domain-containing protein n=1 Tax=Leclercia sp. TaxID=1898428 RepID=UPI00289D88DA|nr:glucosyltransferase domain-containing protein [Leclercia sp.]
MIKNYFKLYAPLILVFVLPIILANQYYVDDLGRSTIGYTLWGVDGRPIADIIMSTFNLGTRMSDLAPLPLIASACLLALSLAAYRFRFLGSSNWGYIIPLAFFANPSLISMFSYRFDVLTFTSGIALSFLLITLDIKKTILRIIVGAVIVALVMGTYQTLINFIVILSICEFYRNLNISSKPKDVINALSVRIIQVAIGGVIYIKCLLPISFSGVHSNDHPGITSNLFDTIPSNFKVYINFVSTHFYSSAVPNFIVLSIPFCILLSVILICQYAKEHRGNKWFYLVAVISLLASILSLPLAFGALLLLENTLAGSVHIYTPLSGYYLLLATMLYYVIGRYKVLNLVVVIPVFYCLGLMYAYGNALKAQDLVNKQIAYEIKLATTQFDYNTKYIVFSGAAPRASVVKNTVESYPLIDVSVINYFYNWYWAISNLSMNGYQQLYPLPDKALDAQNNMCLYKKFYSNQDFNAYINDNTIVIDFDKRACAE